MCKSPLIVLPCFLIALVALNNAPGGRLAFNMEPPHPKSWRESDQYMTTEEKDRVVEAYQKIHDRGILHDSIHPRHILIGKLLRFQVLYAPIHVILGEDGTVKIIQFQNARLRTVPTVPGCQVPLHE